MSFLQRLQDYAALNGTRFSSHDDSGCLIVPCGDSVELICKLLKTPKDVLFCAQILSRDEMLPLIGNAYALKQILTESLTGATSSGIALAFNPQDGNLIAWLRVPEEHFLCADDVKNIIQRFSAAVPAWHQKFANIPGFSTSDIMDAQRKSDEQNDMHSTDFRYKPQMFI